MFNQTISRVVGLLATSFICDTGGRSQPARDCSAHQRAALQDGEEVIINSGNGPGGGASKLTGDVTQIMAQLPPVLESLTGVKFEKLLQQIPALKSAMGKGEEKG